MVFSVPLFFNVVNLITMKVAHNAPEGHGNDRAHDDRCGDPYHQYALKILVVLTEVADRLLYGVHGMRKTHCCAVSAIP